MASIDMDKDQSGAEDLYEHRHDPGEWGGEAVDIDTRPIRSEMVSFRLPPEELDALEAEARESGLTVSAYIRSTLRERRLSPAWPAHPFQLLSGVSFIVPAVPEGGFPRMGAPGATVSQGRGGGVYGHQGVISDGH